MRALATTAFCLVGLSLLDCGGARSAASPPSSDEWYCFHAMPPVGWRFEGPSSSCHVSEDECEAAREQEIRDGKSRIMFEARRRPARGVDVGLGRGAPSSVNASDRTYTAQSREPPRRPRADPSPLDGEPPADADQPVELEAPPQPEPEPLGAICEIDRSACRAAETRHAELGPCRPATGVRCAPFRHEVEGRTDGPTEHSCHETAEDCARFGRSTPYGVVVRGCEPAR
jgi:hypothetical protein